MSSPVYSSGKMMEDDDSSQMAASGASFSTLPEEIILRIFSFLPPEDLMFGVRPTCRQFYNLSLNRDLWKRILTVTRIEGVETRRSCISEETYNRMLLQQECISNNGSDTFPVSSLIRFVEERGDVWPSCSATGTMHYPNLERLTLYREHVPSLEVLVKYQSLRHLELHMSEFLENDNIQNSERQYLIDLFVNLKGLTNLETLTVDFDCSEWEETTSSISEIQTSMKDYFLTGPRLREIELGVFVNDEILKAILDSCLQLKYLAMIRPELTPEAFCAAVSVKHQLLLSTLKIDDCESLNDTCLKALSAAVPDIESLSLSLSEEITDDGLRLFLEACSQLTDLELTFSSGHKMLSGKISENLQSLALYPSITFPSASAFQKLCQYSPKLCEVRLYSINITNTDLINMTNSCHLLEEVELSYCHHVDSTGVAYLMKNLPHLHDFVCELSDPHLFQLQQLSPSRKRTQAGDLVLENQAGPTEDRLCSLEVSPCQELTAVGVSALALLCPNLCSLKIHTPRPVNDFIVREILRNLPKLELFWLDSTDRSSRQIQLTEACLRHIQRWGTRLKSLRLITPYRSFNIAALVKLLAHSSTLTLCVVPQHTEQSPDIPESEIFRMVNEQNDQLHRQGKKAVATLTQIATLSQDVLEIRVFRR